MCARLLSNAARPPPQAGQTKPSGQRRSNRNAAQLASSGKLAWNSLRDLAFATAGPRAAAGCGRPRGHYTTYRATWDNGISHGRWDIENEYHLQSLLWAVFAPIFDDLDDEEYLKSIGQLKPRCDLAIPSLTLIIEAKFIRPGTSFAKVIGEIAEDVTIYLRSDTPWQHLIAVVWDDAARTEEHHEFLAGLRGIQGIVDAVVIPRPMKMRRDIADVAPKRRRT